jgi:hypothetical protein
MRIETTEKLFTEKRIELKSDTPVFDSYSEAQKEAEHKRSYHSPCFTEKGLFYGWFVAK